MVTGSKHVHIFDSRGVSAHLAVGDGDHSFAGNLAVSHNSFFGNPTDAFRNAPHFDSLFGRGDWIRTSDPLHPMQEIAPQIADKTPVFPNFKHKYLKSLQTNNILAETGLFSEPAIGVGRDRSRGRILTPCFFSGGEMPNRILKESVCTSLSIDRLSPQAEVMFYRLLTVADDRGRFDARAEVLRSKCFPLRIDGVTNSKISAWLGEMISGGIVRLYVVDDVSYGHFIGWEKHQRIRNVNPKFPDPPPVDSNPPQSAAACLSESNPIQSNQNPIQDIVSPSGLTPLALFWNQTCLRLPKVQAISSKRKQKESLRLKSFGFEKLQEAVRKVAQSSFCNGESDRGWRATYEWLINSDENVLKVLEGKYDSRSSALDKSQKSYDDAQAIADAALKMGGSFGIR